ncbi:TetR/AcrR family transcriptional regulator, partial [Salmonella enterica subsp. enterica serovar Typhimurium]
MTEPKLSREAIVDAAIALADEDGLDALSMRRIADRMGVGAMSLYRHVAGKDELIAAMTDEVAGRYPYP